MDVFFGIIMFIMGVFMGYLGSNPNGTMLEACRKQHNVYECRVIAVPKEPEEKK